MLILGSGVDTAFPKAYPGSRYIYLHLRDTYTTDVFARGVFTAIVAGSDQKETMLSLQATRSTVVIRQTDSNQPQVILAFSSLGRGSRSSYNSDRAHRVSWRYSVMPQPWELVRIRLYAALG